MKPGLPLVALFVVLAASTAVEAGGQQCNVDEAQVTGGGTLFQVTWCGPRQQEVGTDFLVTAKAQLSIAGLSMVLETPPTWYTEGCTFQANVDSGATPLTTFYIVRFSMDEPSCTIATTGTTLASPVPVELARLPLQWSIYDPTATLPTETTITNLDDFPTDFTNDITIQDFQDLVGAINGLEFMLNQSVGAQNITFSEGAIDAGGEAQQEFIDYWLPLLFLLVALVWSLHPTRVYLVTAVGLTAGILGYLLTDWPFVFASALFFALAFYWVQAIAVDKIVLHLFKRITNRRQEP